MAHSGLQGTFPQSQLIFTNAYNRKVDSCFFVICICWTLSVGQEWGQGTAGTACVLEGTGLVCAQAW